MADSEGRLPDRLTIAAVAVVAYAVSNVVHEGLGHGGACVLVGCTPHLLTSMHFEGDASSLPASASRIIAAGGTVANLVVAALVLPLLRRKRSFSATTWIFLWLMATLSLLQGTGYFLFSGVGGIGDWAGVIHGLPGGALWRVVMAASGGLAYYLAIRWSTGALGARLLGTGAARTPQAYRYTLVAYVTGGALYLAAGSLDPAGTVMLLVSGAAASLGGTSGLLWGPQLLRDPTFASPQTALPIVRRRWDWVAGAVVCGGAFVLVLGPGIRL